ncbi:MAG TPA: hypothetical protein PLB18_23455 [Acidobacteriota bacterium]|nr:hypothetical protein [Acidobacteriota bacterium]
MSLAEADTFVETCRLGIEPGSFTAVLICPLTPDSSYQPVLSPEFAGEPFARKVTRLLIQSTSLIVESIESGNLDRFLSPSEDSIVSANLCDALLGMKLSGKSAQLRITPAWSQKYPVPTELAAQTVVIKAEYLAEIEQLSQRLRPQRQSQKEWIIGWVETLNGEPGTDGAMQGEVTVSGFTESSDHIRGKIYLSAADYANAGEAHLNNWPVQIHGQVERARRTYLITEYDRFGVLTEE